MSMKGSRPVMLAATAMLTAFVSLGFTVTANAWSLEEAAAPYKGATIRTIGECGSS